jgi:23S rRNA (adenine2503-C2)-methyltransferase
MRDIKELTLSELEENLKKSKQPAFHAKQIYSWIYKRGVLDFDQMTDLPSQLRRLLKENFFLSGLKLIKVLESKDETKKFLFELQDGNFIEAVTIPVQKRLTGCISVQVGCKFGCRFCASGLLGFKRNLTSAEMIEEVIHLINNVKDKKLTHLVFMGIGEPLDNYDNVLRAIRIINSCEGLHIGARRITISTCGLIPEIERLSKENLQIELSISLHAADDRTRSLIMPVNKIYPLAELIKACQDYIKKTNRQLTFEYVLIKGVNSDLQSAKNLGKILKNLKLCKVNLIPANSIKELKIEPPNKLEILFFRDTLLKLGVNATLRRPRGQDIDAACGQLRLRYVKK